MKKIISIILLLTINFNLMSLDYELISKELNKTALDRYLDRADLMETEEQWEKLALFGVTVTTAKWEKEKSFIDSEKKELRREIKKRVSDRHSQWLVKNYLNKKTGFQVSNLIQEIQNINSKLLYKDIESKEQIYRGKENLDSDKISWLNQVNYKIDNLINDFAQPSTNNNDLTSLPYYITTLEEYTASYRKQLQRIRNFEWEQFVIRRSRDQESLREQSEYEEASSISQKLIMKTQKELNLGLLQLQKSLKLDKPEELDHSTVIEADKWKSQFEDLFNRGMKKWENTEEELLLHRMTWEQNSKDQLKQGEDLWIEAFHTIQKSQEKWQTKLQTILNEGATLWAEKELDLNQAIKEAQLHLENSIASEKQNFENQLEGLINMYLDSLSMIASADESLLFWKSRLNEKDNNALSHIDFWKKNKQIYSEYLENASTQLTKVYGIVLTDDKNYTTYEDLSLYSHNFGIDKLLKTAITQNQNFVFDEYQSEIVKAKIIKEYWDKQYYIAQEVYLYSQENSSNRARSIETKKAYSLAMKEYMEAKKLYQDCLNLLTDEYNNIQEKQENLLTCKENLKNIQKSLELIKNQINEIQTLLNSENELFFKDKIDIKTKELRIKMGLEEKENIIISPAIEYFSKAKAYFLKEKYRTISLDIINLINGNEIQKLLPLKTLEDNYKKVEIWKFQDPSNLEISLQFDNLNLQPSDPRYLQLLNEYKWYQKINNLSHYNLSEKGILKAISEERINSIARQIKLEHFQKLTLRNFQIKSLSSENFLDWKNKMNLPSEAIDNETWIQTWGLDRDDLFLFNKNSEEGALCQRMLDLLKNNPNLEFENIKDKKESDPKTYLGGLLLLNALTFGFFTKKSLTENLEEILDAHHCIEKCFSVNKKLDRESLKNLILESQRVKEILDGKGISLISIHPDLVDPENEGDLIYRLGKIGLKTIYKVQRLNQRDQLVVKTYFSSYLKTPQRDLEQKEAHLTDLSNFLSSYSINKEASLEETWQNYKTRQIPLDIYCESLIKEFNSIIAPLPSYYKDEVSKGVNLAIQGLIIKGVENEEIIDLSLLNKTKEEAPSIEIQLSDRLKLLSSLKKNLIPISKENSSHASLANLLLLKKTISTLNEPTPISQNLINEQIIKDFQNRLIKKVRPQNRELWSSIKRPEIEEALNQILLDDSIALYFNLRELKDSEQNLLDRIIKQSENQIRYLSLINNEVSLDDLSLKEKEFSLKFLYTHYHSLHPLKDNALSENSKDELLYLISLFKEMSSQWSNKEDLEKTIDLFIKEYFTLESEEIFPLILKIKENYKDHKNSSKLYIDINRVNLPKISLENLEQILKEEKNKTNYKISFEDSIFYHNLLGELIAKNYIFQLYKDLQSLDSLSYFNLISKKIIEKSAFDLTSFIKVFNNNNNKNLFMENEFISLYQKIEKLILEEKSFSTALEKRALLLNMKELSSFEFQETLKISINNILNISSILPLLIKEENLQGSFFNRTTQALLLNKLKHLDSSQYLIDEVLKINNLTPQSMNNSILENFQKVLDTQSFEEALLYFSDPIGTPILQESLMSQGIFLDNIPENLKNLKKSYQIQKQYIPIIDGLKEDYLNSIEEFPIEQNIQNRAILFLNQNPEAIQSSCDFSLKKNYNDLISEFFFSEISKYFNKYSNNKLKEYKNLLEQKKVQQEYDKIYNRYEINKQNYRAYLLLNETKIEHEGEKKIFFFKNELLENQFLRNEQNKLIDLSNKSISNNYYEINEIQNLKKLSQDLSLIIDTNRLNLSKEKNEYNISLKVYFSTLTNLEDIKQNIVENGYNLSILKNQDETIKLKSQIIEKEEELQKLEDEYENKLFLWDKESSDLTENIKIYNTLYKQMTNKETLFNQKQFELDKKEAVYEYASSPYLGDNKGLIKEEDNILPEVDPKGLIIKMIKKQAFSIAQYEALRSIYKEEKRTDFIERDPLYKSYYDQFFKEAKIKIQLKKLSTLLNKKLIDQKNSIKSAKYDMDQNIKDGMLLPLSSPSNLKEVPLNMMSLMNLNLSNSFGEALYSKNSPEGFDTEKQTVNFLKTKFSDGKKSNTFLNKNYRNIYFYFGGTILDLVQKQGFLLEEAELQKQQYYEKYKNKSYYNDQIIWMDKMEIFLSKKDTYLTFSNWAQAAWYQRYKMGQEFGQTNTPAGQLWKESQKTYSLPGLMSAGGDSAIKAHSDGKKTEQIFYKKAKESYQNIKNEEKQLFNFFSTVQKLSALTWGDKMADKNLLRTQMKVLLGDIFSQEANKKIDKQYITMNVSIVVWEGLLATMLSLIGGIFTSFLGFAMAGAVAVASGKMIASIKEYDSLIEERDELLKEIYMGNSHKETRTITQVNYLTHLIKKSITLHKEKHNHYNSEVAKLNILKGGIEKEGTMTQKSLEASIKMALNLEGISLKDFLQLDSMTDEKTYLTDLLTPYTDDVNLQNNQQKIESDDYIKLYYKLVSNNVILSKNNLINRSLTLKNKQITKILNYEESKENLENFFKNSKVDNLRCNLESSTLFYNIISPDETNSYSSSLHDLTEAFKESIKNTWIKSSFNDRTHQMLIGETELSLLQFTENHSQGSKIPINTFIENQEKTLRELKQTLLSLQDQKLSITKEIHKEKWNMMQLDFIQNKSKWNNTVKAILIRGNRAWYRSKGQVQSQRELWIKEFKNQYKEKIEQWDIKYTVFLQSKTKWIKNIAVNLTTACSKNFILNDLNTDIEIRSSTKKLLSQMDIVTPSPQSIVDKIISNNIFEDLLSDANFSNQKIKRTKKDSHSFFISQSHNKESLNIAKSIIDFQKKDKKKIEKELLSITAIQVADQIKGVKEGFIKAVDYANKGVSDSLDNTFYESGWNIDGRVYNKNLVVDNTLIDGVIRQKREINKFKDFDYTDHLKNFCKINLDISEIGIKNAASIERILIIATNTVKQAYKEVFGEKGADKIVRNIVLNDRVKRDKFFLESIGFGNTEDFKNIQKKDSRSINQGSFYAHVGIAAELKQVPDMSIVYKNSKFSNLRYKGEQEMGRIMGAFLIYKLEESRGWAEVNKPAWETRIFDDDNSFMKSPTIKGVSDILVTIAGAATANPWIGFALKTASSLGYTTMDISGRYKSAQQSFTNFGIQTLASAGSIGLGALGGQLNIGSGGTAFNNFMSQTLYSTGTSVATSGISNLSAGFQWDGDGNFKGFSSEAYGMAMTNSMVNSGKSLLFSSINKVTSASVNGLFNLEDLESSGWGAFANNVNNIGNLAGKAAQFGAEYGINGEASINLLNLTDFGSDINSGLLQLNFSKKNGINTSLGTGGIQTNLEFIKSVTKGAYLLNEEHDINKMAHAFTKSLNKNNETQYTVDETSRLHRMLRSSGDRRTRADAKDLLRNKIDLTIGQNGEAKAQSILKNRRKEILLNTLNLDSSEGYYDTVTTLAHEAYRNGIDNGERGQRLETRRAVKSHINTIENLSKNYGMGVLTGNSSRLIDYFSYKAEEDDYVDRAYDSSADYWKLTTDGRLINDNQADLYLADKNENYIKKDGKKIKLIDSDTSSVSQALIQYIGMERAKEILNINPKNMSVYDEKTIKDVLGATQRDLKQYNINYDSLSLPEKQKLMGELLMKKGANQSWNAKDKWHGSSKEDIAKFKVTEDWDGYSIGFDNTMKNGEYNKFIVDIVHNRDMRSYWGSTGDYELKKKYNALDTSGYTKKTLKGYEKSFFKIDQVQTVDNIWGDKFDQRTVDHPLFGQIQGNTIAANNPFFSRFGQRSDDYEKDVFVLNHALTLFGTHINHRGMDSLIPRWTERWLSHQRTLKNKKNKFKGLGSDGCIINTDVHMKEINLNLNQWGVYKDFNMGTIIKEDPRSLYDY